MFSLIVTIIAIALVAVLALATIYYGGDILVSQKAKTASGTLDAQAQQVFAAAQAYYHDHGNWPANVAVLTAGGHYLSAAPVPPPSAYKTAMAGGLVSTAYADGNGAANLPALTRPAADYMANASLLGADYGLAIADAAVLKSQLQKLQTQTDASGTDLATRTLQLMQLEKSTQVSGKPSALDYTWPIAASQTPRSRFMWVPAKIDKDVCLASNYRWRNTTTVPEAYSALNGSVQCFGNDTAGYSYLWLAPSGTPLEVAAELVALGAAVDLAGGVGGGSGNGSSGGGSGGAARNRVSIAPDCSEAYNFNLVAYMADNAIGLGTNDDVELDISSCAFYRHWALHAGEPNFATGTLPAGAHLYIVNNGFTTVIDQNFDGLPAFVIQTPTTIEGSGLIYIQNWAPQMVELSMPLTVKSAFYLEDMFSSSVPGNFDTWFDCTQGCAQFDRQVMPASLLDCTEGHCLSRNTP